MIKLLGDDKNPMNSLSRNVSNKVNEKIKVESFS